MKIKIKNVEVEDGDIVSIYTSRNDVDKIETGHAYGASKVGLFVASDFNYTASSKHLRIAKYGDYIHEENILNIEVLKTRKEILSELEKLAKSKEEKSD